jgi:hypothetical protein
MTLVVRSMTTGPAHVVAGSADAPETKRREVGSAIETLSPSVGPVPVESE